MNREIYMKKILTDVPHAFDKNSSEHAIQVFNEPGSHYLTNAAWGCMDDCKIDFK